MIFDAYLTEISQSGADSKKLKYFYQNKSDFKDRILIQEHFLSGWGSIFKKLSPIQDMRPNTNRSICVEDENNLEQIFNFVYHVRCNLFHGAKDMKNEKDAELVRRGAKFLRTAIEYWMRGG
jgi:hypothetical protein